MRLTIIPIDKSVYKDNLCYLNLEWQGTPSNIHALQWFDSNTGWIEYVDNTPNENITVLPDWVNNALDAWQVAYDNAHQPPQPPSAQQNKDIAKQLLTDTDWTTIADVSDPNLSDPYLTNVADFIDYRNQIRRIAINPVAGEIIWPTIPTANWSTK